MKQLSCRISWETALRNDLPRLITAVHYSERMRLAGVPEKIRLKVLRRFRPFPWFVRKEIAGLILDISSRKGVE